MRSLSLSSSILLRSFTFLADAQGSSEDEDAGVIGVAGVHNEEAEQVLGGSRGERAPKHRAKGGSLGKVGVKEAKRT